MTIKKAHTANDTGLKTFTANYNTFGCATNRALLDVSAGAQRGRILAHLKTNRSLTTLEARQNLNIMHPAARVMELKERGYHIITNRRKDVDSEGRLHSVAEYVLMPSKGAVK